MTSPSIVIDTSARPALRASWMRLLACDRAAGRYVDARRDRSAQTPEHHRAKLGEAMPPQ
jgi:hypothetical protein